MGSVLALDEHLDQRLDAEFDQIAGHLNAQHARLVRSPPDCSPNPAHGRSPVSTPSSSTCAGGPGSAPPTPTRSPASPGVSTSYQPAWTLFQRGELSLDQMAAIVAKTPAWADHRVAELAPMLTVRQLRRTLGKYRFPDAVEADPTDDLPNRNRSNRNPVRTRNRRRRRPIRRIRVGSGSVTTAGSISISTATNSRGMIIDNALREAKDHLVPTRSHRRHLVRRIRRDRPTIPRCDRQRRSSQPVADQHPPAHRPDAAPTRPASTCPTPSAATSPATGCCHRCSTPTVCRSPSVAPNTSSPTAPAVS